jgi:hypothetical protein
VYQSTLRTAGIVSLNAVSDDPRLKGKIAMKPRHAAALAIVGCI